MIRDTEQIEINKKNSHRNLWNYCESHRNRDFRRMGQIGKRLRQSRNNADYEDVFNKLERELKTSIKQADKFNELMSKLKKSF